MEPGGVAIVVWLKSLGRTLRLRKKEDTLESRISSLLQVQSSPIGLTLFFISFFLLSHLSFFFFYHFLSSHSLHRISLREIQLFFISVFLLPHITLFSVISLPSSSLSICFSSSRNSSVLPSSRVDEVASSNHCSLPSPVPSCLASLPPSLPPHRPFLPPAHLITVTRTQRWAVTRHIHPRNILPGNSQTRGSFLSPFSLRQLYPVRTLAAIT